MRRASLLFLVFGLISGCRGELDTRERIERDLDKRTIREVYDEAESMRFTHPADGLITQRHIDDYVRVEGLAREIKAVAEERLDRDLNEASRSDGRFTRMAATFSGIGNLRAATTAHLRAALMLEVNPNEMSWVRAQLYEASRVCEAKDGLEKAVSGLTAELEAERDAYMRERIRERLVSAEEQKRRWLETIDDVRIVNCATIEKNRIALARLSR